MGNCDTHGLLVNVIWRREQLDEPHIAGIYEAALNGIGYLYLYLNQHVAAGCALYHITNCV